MPPRLERARRVGLTLVLALAAALAAGQLRLPLPWMIGPLLATAACGMAGLKPASSNRLRNAGLWMIGVALGLYFTPSVMALLLPLAPALLVPVMEEIFWRSFLLRWFQHPVFESVAPARVGLKAVVLATFLFVLAHTLWLAAIVAGLAYAWLYIHTEKLWVAVIAHAVTNGILGAWVLATGNWQFW